MASVTDFPARGKVISFTDDKVVFAPAGTNYQLHLQTSARYAGPINTLIEASIRAKARKIYTVPSGGGFIAPIFGPPRIVQGRAVFVDEKSIVIRAGVPVIVEIPQADDAIDLSSGQIAVGSIVNAVTLPGAVFQLLEAAMVK